MNSPIYVFPSGQDESLATKQQSLAPPPDVVVVVVLDGFVVVGSLALADASPITTSFVFPLLASAPSAEAEAESIVAVVDIANNDIVV